MSPFDFVNSISSNKKNLMRGTENDEFAEKSYSGFLVNRALSYFTDTLLYANEINKHPDLDGVMQYEYLLYSIRQGKRFSKWAKNQTSEEILAISKYFQVNHRKASEYLKILPKEKVKEIIEVINN